MKIVYVEFFVWEQRTRLDVVNVEHTLGLPATGASSAVAEEYLVTDVCPFTCHVELAAWHAVLIRNKVLRASDHVVIVDARLCGGFPECLGLGDFRGLGFGRVAGCLPGCAFCGCFLLPALGCVRGCFSVFSDLPVRVEVQRRRHDLVFSTSVLYLQACFNDNLFTVGVVSVFLFDKQEVTCFE